MEGGFSRKMELDLGIEWVSFPECERSREKPGLWMLAVHYDTVCDEYRVRIQSGAIRTDLFFTNETLPDYFKDPISIITTWHKDNVPNWDRRKTAARYFSLNPRPNWVPKEFIEIGWVCIPYGDIFAVAMNYDQLKDLYDKGPQ